jgi:cystathionine beta-lyase family protein involved in aluminum resistance
MAFCEVIQKCSPVDSFVRPEPWDMPGYDGQVIMAAGTFVQGSSIELSADGPMKPPFIAYLQGGLVSEQTMLAAMLAVGQMGVLSK